jgi:hypothetical protein
MTETGTTVTTTSLPPISSGNSSGFTGADSYSVNSAGASVGGGSLGASSAAARTTGAAAGENVRVEPDKLTGLSKELLQIADDFKELTQLCESNPPPPDGSPPIAFYVQTAIRYLADRFLEDSKKGEQKFRLLAEKVNETAESYRATDQDSVADLDQAGAKGDGAGPAAGDGAGPAAGDGAGPAAGGEDAAREELEWRDRRDAAVNLVDARLQEYDDLQGKVLNLQSEVRSEDVQAGYDRWATQQELPVGGSLRDEYETLERNVDAYQGRLDSLDNISRTTTDHAQIEAIETLANKTHTEIVDATTALRNQIALGARTFNAYDTSDEFEENMLSDDD